MIGRSHRFAKDYAQLVSGHGHSFPVPGNSGSGHGAGFPHIPYSQLPSNWITLPTGIPPHTPIGQ